MKRNYSVSRIARKDMGEELVNQKSCMQEGIADYWDVGTTAIFTKEQRRLNRELGLNTVNFTSKSMTRKRRLKNDRM